MPQGTINGPPIFSLFANDAPSTLKYCNHHFYADDLTIYCSGSFKEINNIVEKVNIDLKNLSSWAKSNGLIINANKTQAIWFGTRGFISRLRDMLPPLPRIDGQAIDFSHEIKLLGATLDSTLSWTQHCGETSRKTYAALARLRKCSHCLPSNVKLTLVKSLVLPYFDYAPGILLSLTQENSLKLHRCMNAALRFIVGLKKSDHITPTYKALGLLPYEARRTHLCLSLLANILHNVVPNYLSSRFHFRDKDNS